MLHYTLTAPRPTVVLLLHGYGEDSRMWQYFSRGLLKDFQILRADLPGFGKSPLTEATSIADMARAIKEILDTEGIEKLIFVGHSMGGYVATEFAKQFPQMLQGLCLFHSHPFADTRETVKKRTKSAAFISDKTKAIYTQQLFDTIFPAAFPDRKLKEKLAARAAAFPTQGLINGQLAMRDRADNADVLRGLNCPVQFIIGSEDSAVSTEFNRAQTHLPDTADIQIFPHMGHMGMFENPSETKRVMKAFLHFCKDFSRISA